MSTVVLLLICGFAVAQLVRLYRDDTVTEPLRNWVGGHLESADEFTRFNRLRDWLTELLDCAFCLSGWLSIIVVAGVDLLSDHPVPIPVVFTLAVWRVALIAYWLVETLSDWDNEIVTPTTRRIRVDS